MSHLVIVGDALLDRDVVGSIERLSPDAPVPVVDVDEAAGVSRPGGAGLAALLAASDRDGDGDGGHGLTVTLVTALGDDAAGDEVRSLLGACGVDVIDLGLADGGRTPEKTRVRGSGVPLVRIDHGATATAPRPLTAAARAAIAAADGVLVSDYGRGVASTDDVRDALSSFVASGGRRSLVWDPHPRGGAPVRGARLVTPNREEAGLTSSCGWVEATRRARALARRWGAQGVVVTLGARGALLADGRDPASPPLVLPIERPVSGGDPCGAGDRFASTVSLRLLDGCVPSEAVAGAVRAASAFVARGGASSVATATGRVTIDLRDGAFRDASPVERVRAGGGKVVATGGCFDLLHAGHVHTLEAARALGDCLVVLLNSDESVRRLKGPGRPLQAVADRAAVLQGLGCVDEVVVFDEDTPDAALERVRPDVWVKGGDYTLAAMPEAAVVARWGGVAITLPYLEGRSTSGLVERAKSQGGRRHVGA
jgi:D-beta-D-heptose 7-phosphate kinase/D-beta-D-heptose 1-phosphate adenosyltransferase